MTRRILSMQGFQLAEGESLVVFDGGDADAPLLYVLNGPAIPDDITRRSAVVLAPRGDTVFYELRFLRPPAHPTRTFHGMSIGAMFKLSSTRLLVIMTSCRNRVLFWSTIVRTCTTRGAAS